MGSLLRWLDRHVWVVVPPLVGVVHLWGPINMLVSDLSCGVRPVAVGLIVVVLCKCHCVFV
jgi:hypothetical protein